MNTVPQLTDKMRVGKEITSSQNCRVSYKLQMLGTESFTKWRVIRANSVSLRRKYASEDRVMAGKAHPDFAIDRVKAGKAHLDFAIDRVMAGKAHLDLYNFKLSNFRLTRFQKLNKLKNTFLKGVPSFSLREWKCNGKNMAEEYCWAMTKAAGRSCCDRSRCWMSDFGFQLDCLFCTYIADSMYSQFRLAQNATCDGPAGG